MRLRQTVAFPQKQEIFHFSAQHTSAAAAHIKLSLCESALTKLLKILLALHKSLQTCNKILQAFNQILQALHKNLQTCKQTFTSLEVVTFC